MSPDLPPDDALDEPLARALRAPGTPDELAQRERYLEIFRTERDAPVVLLRPRGRAVRRAGAGTVLAGILAIGGGGVAAAYTGSLPVPLQRTAHRVLGPIGVPAAPVAARDEPVRAAPSPVAPSTVAPSTGAPPSRATPAPTSPAPSSASPAPGPRPSTRPSRTPGVVVTPGPGDPAGVGDQPTGLPTGAPTGGPTGGPTDSATSGPSDPPTTDPTAGPTTDPTSAPTGSPTVAVKPALVTVLGTDRQVDVGATTVISGTVFSRSRRAVPDTLVLLEQKVQGRWRRVRSGRSDGSGSVSLSTSPVLGSTAFRLRAGEVVSPAWRVAAHPVMTVVSVTPASGGADGAAVTVDVAGAQPGELVRLVARRPRGDVVVTRARVAPDGSAVLTLAPSEARSRYVAVLAATPRHTSAEVAVTLPG